MPDHHSDPTGQAIHVAIEQVTIVSVGHLTSAVRRRSLRLRRARTARRTALTSLSLMALVGLLMSGVALQRGARPQRVVTGAAPGWSGPPASTARSTTSLPASTSCPPLQAILEPKYQLPPAPAVSLAWLPPGATASYCRYPGSILVQIALPGKANANTIAGTVTVTVVSGLSKPPPIRAELPYSAVRTVVVKGYLATESYPANRGLGGYLIAWFEAGNYVQVGTDRGRTSSGESGVPLDELTRIANGVRLG